MRLDDKNQIKIKLLFSLKIALIYNKNTGTGYAVISSYRIVINSNIFTNADRCPLLVIFLHIRQNVREFSFIHRSRYKSAIVDRPKPLY